MPGVPGRGGPVPKRSEQRHGHRSKDETRSVTRAPGAEEFEVPEPHEDWHPVARNWYLALGESGQASFYEPSDWATAILIAENISRELNPQIVGTDDDGQPTYATVPMKGASLAAYLKAMTSLLVTEGDRRRVKLELERSADEPDDSVPSIDDYRDRLSG